MAFFRKNKRLKKLVSVAAVLLITCFIAVNIFISYLHSRPLPVAYIPQISQIYDHSGMVIDTLTAGQHRQNVKLQHISPYLIQATLSIEDHRFYRHAGFDMYGIARAAWVDLKHMDMVQGASTITQQLARNLYLTHDKTWSRKFKEALFAAQLELQFSKDEILQQYLNQIYYGHATYGIQSAAQLFFGKDAAELTLAESALLAGIPKGPKFYSPYLNEEKAKARQQMVLQAMVTHGHITEQEAEAAQQEQLVFSPLQKKPPAAAPYFRDYVVRQALQLLQIDEETFSEGGYQIYTSLDLEAQQAAEEVIAQHLNGTELQVALVAIDPRNGHIKAMVGGRDYGENQFNRVFSSSRQPGSSFKPIVYLAALQQPDFTAVTQFKSEPTVFRYDEGRRNYIPQNFGKSYPHKMIDLRYAIARSDNIYAVHTIMQIGAERVIEMAKKLGIQSKLSPLPSLALGTFPVSPFEMAGAFAAIANQGNRHDPVAVLKIIGQNGRILYEYEPQSESVVDPASAYVLTSMLEGVFDQGGTGHRVSSIIKRPTAGKTGTTKTDSWMVGFTPELATAVWVGYDRDRELRTVDTRHAAPIFAEFTERALAGTAPKLFAVPDHIVSLYIDPVSGKMATAECPNPRLEHFVKGTEPLQYCQDHLAELELEEVPPLPLPKEEERHPTLWQKLKKWWNE